LDGPPCCEPCIEPPPPPADPAAPPAEAPKTSQALPAEDGLVLATSENDAPALMAQSNAGQPAATDTKAAASAEPETDSAATDLPALEDAGETGVESDGILIPGFPEEAPAPTAETQLMARAPVAEGQPEPGLPEFEPASLNADQGRTASAALPHLADLAVLPGGKQHLFTVGGSKPLERQINAEKETASAEDGEGETDTADSGSESDS
jgi:hypothetical protein